MKKVEITPSATLVAQHPAGVPVEAIIDGGKVFIPVLDLGSALNVASDDDEEETPAPKKSTAPAKEEKEQKLYTEDELMEMDTKELTKLCISMGVDPDEHDGKNTNKKLRLLVLGAQKPSTKKAAAKEAPVDDEEEAPADDLGEKVEEILNSVDEGDIAPKKAVSKICNLSEDCDEAAIAKLVDQFTKDSDTEMEAFVKKFVKALGGKPVTKKEAEEDDEEEETPKKAPAKGKGKKDDDLVEKGDLEEGDKVSVYWESQEEWYEGEVTSIKKGKVTVTYEDGDVEAIDPEEHTKIKRLA